MDKMNQAFEKVKILVGMEVEDELPAEDETSFAFLDDFNRNCTLSTKQVLSLSLSPHMHAHTSTNASRFT